jgi:hypothetical protein
MANLVKLGEVLLNHGLFLIQKLIYYVGLITIIGVCGYFILKGTLFQEVAGVLSIVVILTIAVSVKKS